jgi:hypothetical protein
MFRNGEFLSEFTLTSSSSPTSTTNSIRSALQQQQQSFNLNDHLNPTSNGQALQSHTDLKESDENSSNEQPDQKEDNVFDTSFENKTISLDQCCSSNVDENNNKLSCLTKIVNNIYTLNAKSISPRTENKTSASKCEQISGDMFIFNSVSSPILASNSLSQPQIYHTSPQNSPATPSTGRKLKKLKPNSCNQDSTNRNLIKADFDINSNSLLSNSLQINSSPCFKSTSNTSARLESTLNSSLAESNKPKKKPRKNTVNSLNNEMSQTKQVTETDQPNTGVMDTDNTAVQEASKTEPSTISTDMSCSSGSTTQSSSVVNLAPSEHFFINNQDNVNSTCTDHTPNTYKVRKMKTLPPLATKIMNEWYELHSDKPYPTDDERRQMAIMGQINEVQVKAWFANKRNRNSNTRAKLGVGRNHRTLKSDELENANVIQNVLTVDVNGDNSALITQHSCQENKIFETNFGQASVGNLNSKDKTSGRKRTIKQNKPSKLAINAFINSNQSHNEEQEESVEQDQEQTTEMKLIKQKNQPKEKSKRGKIQSKQKQQQQEQIAIDDAQIIDSISAAVVVALNSSKLQPNLTHSHTTFSSSSILSNQMMLEQRELMQNSSTNNFHPSNATQHEIAEETEMDTSQRNSYQQFPQSNTGNYMNNQYQHQHYHQQQQSVSGNTNVNLYQQQHQIYNDLFLSQNPNLSQSSSIINYPNTFTDNSTTGLLNSSSDLMANKYYTHNQTSNSTSSGQYSSNSQSNGIMYSNQQLYDQFYNQQQPQHYASMSHLISHMPSNSRQYNNYSSGLMAPNLYDSTNSSAVALSSDSQMTCGFCSASDFISTNSNLNNYQSNSFNGHLNSSMHHYHNNNHNHPHYYQPLQHHQQNQQHPCDTPPPITDKMTLTDTTSSIDATLNDPFHSNLLNNSNCHNQSTLSEMNQQTKMRNTQQSASILDALHFDQPNVYHADQSQQMLDSPYDVNNNKIKNGADLSGECNQDFINETLVNESSCKMSVDTKEIDFYSGKENLIQSSSSSSVSSGLSSNVNSPESFSNSSTYSSCSYNTSHLNNLLVSKNSAFQYYAKQPNVFYSNTQKDKLISNVNVNFSNQHAMKLGQSLSEYDVRFTDSKAKEWCMSSHPRLSSTLLNNNNNNSQSIMTMLRSPLTSSPSPVFNNAVFMQDEPNNSISYSNYNKSSLNYTPNINTISTSNTLPNLRLVKNQGNNINTSYSMNDSIRYQIEQQQQFNDTGIVNNSVSNSNF